MKDNNNLTTIFGLIAAICASVLGTGVFVIGSPVFVGISTLGAISLGIMGFFAKDKNKPNILP
jgi:hypothetical protein